MKNIKYFIHFFATIVIYFLYVYVISDVAGNLFGCPCPSFDESGNIIVKQFSANDFTKVFWIFFSLVLIAISVILSLKIKNITRKVIYIIFSVILSIVLSYVCFFASPMWV